MAHIGGQPMPLFDEDVLNLEVVEGETVEGEVIEERMPDSRSQDDRQGCDKVEDLGVAAAARVISKHHYT